LIFGARNALVVSSSGLQLRAAEPGV
jgi:hypothetical protein